MFSGGTGKTSIMIASAQFINGLCPTYCLNAHEMQLSKRFLSHQDIHEIFKYFMRWTQQQLAGLSTQLWSWNIRNSYILAEFRLVALNISIMLFHWTFNRTHWAYCYHTMPSIASSYCGLSRGCASFGCFHLTMPSLAFDYAFTICKLAR